MPVPPYLSNDPNVRATIPATSGYDYSQPFVQSPTYAAPRLPSNGQSATASTVKSMVSGALGLFSGGSLGALGGVLGGTPGDTSSATSATGDTNYRTGTRASNIADIARGALGNFQVTSGQGSARNSGGGGGAGGATLGSFDWKPFAILGGIAAAFYLLTKLI